MKQVRTGVVSISLLWCVASASAFPTYFEAWKAKYPDSTLPARMQAATGSECNVCHHPPARSVEGNCYRLDLRDLLNGGLSVEDAIDQLDGQDSDGDGVSNGREATTRRADDPAEVGYNMGLVGNSGTDPCAPDPDEVVTGMLETPPPAPVPAVSVWSSLGMMLMLLATGAGACVRRRVSRPGCA